MASLNDQCGRPCLSLELHQARRPLHIAPIPHRRRPLLRLLRRRGLRRARLSRRGGVRRRGGLRRTLRLRRRGGLLDHRATGGVLLRHHGT